MATLTAIGLMSGTSMDGIDAAILETDGERVVRGRGSLSRPYDRAFRDELAQAVTIAAAAADAVAVRRELAATEARLTDLHADAVTDLLERSAMRAGEIDVVGFHGQTVLHRPERRLTIQLGDGTRLAGRIGIPVVNDFRVADVAAGGEGAPLAPAYHRALALASGIIPQAVVNIGGVANVTWIAADADPIAFDTGPGNALIDDLVSARTGKAFDRDGRIAAAGTVDRAALRALLDDPYFARPPPKSLDRNAFSPRPVEGLALADALATLAAFTAEAIAGSVRAMPVPPGRWVVVGGGRKNQAIMAALGERVDAPVITAEEAGWHGDDIEAEAFAYLAVRSLKGLPLSWPSTTGVAAPQTGGVLRTVGDAAKGGRRG